MKEGMREEEIWRQALEMDRYRDRQNRKGIKVYAREKRSYGDHHERLRDTETDRKEADIAENDIKIEFEIVKRQKVLESFAIPVQSKMKVCEIFYVS